MSRSLKCLAIFENYITFALLLLLIEDMDRNKNVLLIIHIETTLQHDSFNLDNTTGYCQEVINDKLYLPL